MENYNEVIPDDLLDYLQCNLNGFELENIKHQRELVKMLWLSNTKQRQHSYFKDAIWFSYKELKDSFGRDKFPSINERLNFFQVTNNWESGINPNNPKVHTKGYWLSHEVNQLWQDYLKDYQKRPAEMLRADGKVQRTLPKAVASKDMRGKTTTAWCNTSTLNRVQVDLDMLESLKKCFMIIRDHYCEKPTSTGQSPHQPSLATIERLVTAISQLIKIAMMDLGGYGYVPHRYVEAMSGRLYATGINLQGAPTVIKQAALNGLWEYDFSNCHFDIIMQMARKYDYECQAIHHYLENKQATRYAIAMQADITETEVKKCLLAIMFGAKASTWHENAIPQEIGVEAAKRLYRIPLFIGIRANVEGARKIILKNWKRTANGSLTNIFGKAIKGTETKPQQLAHLIQGVEAKALQAAINLNANEMVLLQHDGFVATEQLNKEAIMEAVFDATGYRLTLEEEIIMVDIEGQFKKYGVPHNPKCIDLNSPMTASLYQGANVS